MNERTNVTVNVWRFGKQTDEWGFIHLFGSRFFFTLAVWAVADASEVSFLFFVFVVVFIILIYLPLTLVPKPEQEWHTITTRTGCLSFALFCLFLFLLCLLVCLFVCLGLLLSSLFCLVFISDLWWRWWREGGGLCGEGAPVFLHVSLSMQTTALKLISSLVGTRSTEPHVELHLWGLYNLERKITFTCAHSCTVGTLASY